MGCLGPLETQSIQDFVAGTTRDSPLLDEVSVDSPAFTDNEIVAFYPSEMTRGSLILCHEDEFDVITLSIGGKADAEVLAKRLWQSSSSVICVLAGEELELGGHEIRGFLRSGEAVDMPPLCTVALLGEVDGRDRQLVVVRKPAA